MVGHVDEGRLVAGRYRLLERIGRGGMGTVWRAEDELLGRQVAVKKLHPPQPHMDEEELATLFERTRREARAAARISHPNVIVVHDVVDDAGLPSIVMEYVPSLTLGERLKQDGALPVAEVARIGRGMIAALRAAHSAGILHRDVKPGNVLLGQAADPARPGGHAGRVVLTDFGIAQASGTSTLTRTGELIGSIDFLSPERIRGVPPGPEADLWALGATLYQAVEGASAFRRPTAIETAYAIAEEPVRPAPNAGPLTRVIAGLLAKEPGERLSAEDAEWMLRLPAAEPDTALVDGARFEAPAGYGSESGTYVQQGGVYGQSATLPGPQGAAPADPQQGARPPGAYDPATARVGGGATRYAPGDEAAAAHGQEPPTGPTGPTGVHQRPRRAGRWIGAALAVAVLAAGTALVVQHQRASHRGGTAAPTTPVSTAPVTTPPTTAPTTPTPTTASPPPPVPDGYHLEHVTDRGYSVPVPDGWNRQPQGPNGDDEVNWVSPDGRSGLKVSALDFGSANPYKHFLNLEPQTQSQVDHYHRERLDSTEQFGDPAAIWEFTFQGTKRKFHAIDLGFGKPGDTEYAIYLSAPDADWKTAHLPVFDTALAGFRLSGG
jgi:tRNA A-37 threonylcarbamoyl transferase component Bud32